MTGINATKIIQNFRSCEYFAVRRERKISRRIFIFFFSEIGSGAYPHPPWGEEGVGVESESLPASIWDQNSRLGPALRLAADMGPHGGLYASVTPHLSGAHESDGNDSFLDRNAEVLCYRCPNVHVLGVGFDGKDQSIACSEIATVALWLIHPPS
jgi:hypothetical protein